MAATTLNDGPRELLARMASDGIRHLWLVYVDYNGRSQGKAVSPGRFAGAVRHGINFARANLGYDVTDRASAETAFAADSGDFFAVPDLDTYAPLPLFPATGRALCWMRGEDGRPWDGCPRTALAHQVAAYADLGLRVQVAFEPEAYLLREEADGGVVPADLAGMYTVDGLATHASLLYRLAETLEAMGVVVEQVATEYGAGQIEVNVHHAPPLKAADDLITLKETLRELARRDGLIASFMPKPFPDGVGTGLHVHLSLWELGKDRNLMGETGDGHPSGLSPTGRGFVAGLLRHAPALVGIGAPTVNSYKRLQPGTWAPAHAAYGVGNRAALLRLPGGSRPRVEVRSGDHTGNPYLYLAALLAAGLEGIRDGAELGPPATGDLGRLSSDEAAERGIPLLPRSAAEALSLVEADPLMAEALGPVILPEWLRVKRSEIAGYDRAISAWERAAYMGA